MKIIDLKKANIVLLVMAIFMSCQVSVLASAGHTTVKIPVKQVWDSEVSDISDEFSYVMTTDQNNAPMPAGSRGQQYFWTMKNNADAQIIMKVKTAGLYQYKLYQTTEKKDDYRYDQNCYNVIVEAFCDEADQLKVVAVVKNQKGEKVEKIVFKNRYTGKDKEDSSQSSNSPQSHSSDKSDRVKTGDDSPVMGYLILLVISAVCLGILTDENQRRKKEESQK